MHVQWKSIHCGYEPNEELPPRYSERTRIPYEVETTRESWNFNKFVVNLINGCAS